LNRVKRMCGNRSKILNAVICICAKEPDYSDLPDIQYDWSRHNYGELAEVSPNDSPPPLGNHVTLTHDVDGNLMHDIIMGRSVTGILHLANKTPSDWYSKKQSTVESAAYKSEFVAACACVEQVQVMDLRNTARNTLRYLGVLIRERSYMFGDNESEVSSSAQVYAKLRKRHKSQRIIFPSSTRGNASGMLGFYLIPSAINPKRNVITHHRQKGE
jgi:hypothetical protein